MKVGKRLTIAYVFWMSWYLLAIFFLYKAREPFFTPETTDLDIPLVLLTVLLTALCLASWVVFVLYTTHKKDLYGGHINATHKR